MRVVGIDEAGRCPVIGSLIQVGVLCTCSEQVAALQQLGVQDSKKFTPKKRHELAHQIWTWESNARKETGEPRHVAIQFWYPHRIDEYLRRKISINLMEAKGIGIITQYLGAESIVVHRIQRTGIGNKGKDIIRGTWHPSIVDSIKIVDNEDDDPAVATASILATHIKTLEMDSYRRTFPLIGSGNPADKLTRAFIQANLENPPAATIRMEWATVKRMKGLI